MKDTITLDKDLVIPKGTKFFLTQSSGVHQPHYVTDLGFGAKDSTVSVIVHEDFLAEKKELFSEGLTVKKVLAVIEGQNINEMSDGSVVFLGDADIDADGGPNIDHDPYWQPETSLKFNGKSINAQTVPYGVVPPAVIKGVKGVVLGCAMVAVYRGRSIHGVVGDTGPRKKIGELSCEYARRLGMSGNSNTGGTDKQEVTYIIYPGIPAVVDGVNYNLQPS